MAQANKLIPVVDGTAGTPIELTDYRIKVIIPEEFERIPDSVTDYDGNNYDAVIIGNQVWMVDNLRTRHYADGTPITLYTNLYNGSGFADPAITSIPLEDRGYYYNWYGALHVPITQSTTPTNIQGVAPAGWHIPTKEEYETMHSRLVAVFGDPSTKAMASKSYWETSTNANAPGNVAENNNASGLDLIPAGRVYISTNDQITQRAAFWISTQQSASNAYIAFIYNDDPSVYETHGNKSLGWPVRCIYDGTPEQFISNWIDKQILAYDNAHNVFVNKALTITNKQDGISGFDINRFGVCTTASATAAKTVNIQSGAMELKVGTSVYVMFTQNNTANPITLNVNNTGAKPVKIGNNNPGTLLVANIVFHFVYQTTNDSSGTWEMVDAPGLAAIMPTNGNYNFPILTAPIQDMNDSRVTSIRYDTIAKINHSTGIITAGGYVKTNGTSSQFLKADGSIDNTSYQPALPAYTNNAGKILAVNSGETDVEWVSTQECMWYGVRKDRSNDSTTLERIGNLEMHKSLPIQSKMRRCLLLDNGTVNYYLSDTDSTKKEDGVTAAMLDGTDGQVMVEIPEHYVMYDTYTDEVTGHEINEWKISECPLPGFTKVNKCYYSAYEAALDRTNSKLSSVVNNTAQYRGGDNTTSWDNTYRSLLSMPATNLTLTQFRTYAHNRGVNWHPNVYDIYQDLVCLYWCEYANTNCQLPFNATLTQDGYRQGGLGDGVTTWTSSAWNSFNGRNPVVPVGTTLSLGNKTGVVPYSVKNSAGNTVITFQVPSWRGIENLFGHMWTHTDGILVNVQSVAAGGKNLVYVCNDSVHFADTINEHYELQGEQARTEGYTKNIIFPCIVASSVGADSSTGYADYNYTTIPSSGSEVRCVMLGGSATHGALAGILYANSGNVPSDAIANVGSRLCFTPATVEFPPLEGNSGKVLAVNSGATGVEWITQSGGSGIGKETVYAQCYTAAATTQKNVQINDYTQKDGDIVVVYFSNAVPANASLSINSGTALPIFCSAAAITSGVIKAGDTATFMIANAAVAGCLLLGVDRSIKAVTIYSGSTAPSSSTGSDGDIYIQTVS